MNFNEFKDFKLSKPLLDAVKELGYTTPSPIQTKAIPKILAGSDIMAAAQTGTGKTAGFALPILENLSKGKWASANQIRALILTPTRELAAQVGESFKKYGKNLKLNSNVVFGGVKINPQMMKLRGGMDVLVATPGRLIDLYNQNAIKFDRLEVLVLDEADRMLDMGFIRDIQRIIRALPEKRQTLLFSATFSNDIKALAKSLLKSPVEISVAPKQTSAATVKQHVYPVDKQKKKELLTHLIRENQWEQVLVFTKTKHGANRLTEHLQKKAFKVAAIHGNKSQNARTKALESFKSGELDILVATDIAARGLDIKALPQVINYELPQVAEDYVHRIGRTGRAGREGNAFSLISADEAEMLFAIEAVLKKKLTRELISGFEPKHDVPETLVTKPRASFRPKPSQGRSSNPNKSSANKHSVKKSSGQRSHSNVNKSKQRSK
ncbi:MAG: DEAD/DEAH box helicase [Legionellaceae bacterium]|nr:DEAD/DEAH box helicase [Legionellaceae bacterium]